MAFEQFPKDQYFLVLPTDTESPIGYFNLKDGTELKHIMLTMFIRGLVPTPFNIWMNVYGSAEMEVPIFSSQLSEISMATLKPTYSRNYLGNIYLDFSMYPLNPNIDYYMTIETSGYMRNGDSYYVSVNLDWYSPINNQITAGQAGARVRILGKR